MSSCPRCGCSQVEPHVRAEPDSTPYVELAKVASVAEAGYLVSLLEEASIAARSHPAETFNAAQGAWNPAYYLSVPAAEAEAAARILRAEAEGGFEQIAEQVFLSPNGSPDESHGVNPWRMLTVLAIVAAAGTAFLADRFGGQARKPAVKRAQARVAAPRVEPLAALVSALGESRVKLTTTGQQQGPAQQLRYSPEGDTLVLSLDADRDGRYESHRRFSATPLEQ